MQKLIRTYGFCKILNKNYFTLVWISSNVNNVFFSFFAIITNDFKTTVFGVMLMNNWTFAKIVNITNYKKSIL
ncbi:hypothetical protein [Bergeyella zoohelcum]|uniref:Uncharacterized protein n=1 Tax=Bergeyella zoohelcum ATCC 43767 TaxID=883096 RepID=K1M8W5_9FLAO|nr:hypothetical protein [Bergeyella zoohelcum]EKB58763.1 hypothetical protein HMPREF9699_00513 [Bergeyella zoohelcum ATCC 43767]SUV49295.1 Uncharacterised protein [Bergeyella zoohelcum]